VISNVKAIASGRLRIQWPVHWADCNRKFEVRIHIWWVYIDRPVNCEQKSARCTQDIHLGLCLWVWKIRHCQLQSKEFHCDCCISSQDHWNRCYQTCRLMQWMHSSGSLISDPLRLIPFSWFHSFSVGIEIPEWDEHLQIWALYRITQWTITSVISRTFRLPQCRKASVQFVASVPGNRF
jgi:hypothetical protein